MAVDIGKLTSEITGLVGKLKRIAPHDWKGNDAPKKHHFDKDSIVVDADVNIETKHYWVTAKYKDLGVAHTLHAVVPLATGEHVITYDGQDFTADHFAVSFRVGWENGPYTRIVIEFKGTDATGVSHDYRFDGNL